MSIFDIFYPQVTDNAVMGVKPPPEPTPPRWGTPDNQLRLYMEQLRFKHKQIVKETARLKTRWLRARQDLNDDPDKANHDNKKHFEANLGQLKFETWQSLTWNKFRSEQRVAHIAHGLLRGFKYCQIEVLPKDPAQYRPPDFYAIRMLLSEYGSWDQRRFLKVGSSSRRLTFDNVRENRVDYDGVATLISDEVEAHYKAQGKANAKA